VAVGTGQPAAGRIASRWYGGGPVVRPQRPVGPVGYLPGPRRAAHRCARDGDTSLTRAGVNSLSDGAWQGMYGTVFHADRDLDQARSGEAMTGSAARCGLADPRMVCHPCPDDRAIAEELSRCVPRLVEFEKRAAECRSSIARACQYSAVASAIRPRPLAKSTSCRIRVYRHSKSCTLTTRARA